VRGEGTPSDQAVAMCYSQARRAGRSVPTPKKGESSKDYVARVREHGMPDELQDRLFNDRFMNPEYAEHESIAASNLDAMEEELMEVEPPKSFSQMIEEEQEKLRQP